jgi:hypothetical protein
MWPLSSTGRMTSCFVMALPVPEVLLAENCHPGGVGRKGEPCWNASIL